MKISQKEYEERKFQFDREFAKGSLLIKQFLDQRYSASLNIGFRSAAGREQHAKQLEAAKAAEMEKRLKALWDYLQADLFGSKGMDGIEQSLHPSIQIIGVPTTVQYRLIEPVGEILPWKGSDN